MLRKMPSCATFTSMTIRQCNGILLTFAAGLVPSGPGAGLRRSLLPSLSELPTDASPQTSCGASPRSASIPLGAVPICVLFEMGSS